MVHLRLRNVTVEYPLLHVGHRSLKKTIVSRVSGGVILKEAKAPPTVRALDGVSIDIGAGERVGLVGPNGAGKTTMLRTMAGIYEPVSGHVSSDGTVGTLLGISAGMKPELTGLENIELRAMLMGLSRKQAQKLIPEIEEFTELGDFLNVPVRTYSSGMMLRLAFSLATSIKPDILLMDEWMLAGDATFSQKARARLEAVVSNARILVLASHNTNMIAKWCTMAAHLQNGRLIAYGPVGDVVDGYRKTATAA